MGADRTGRSPDPTRPAEAFGAGAGAVVLAGQLGRLADRLRSLSDVRLARDLPSGGSRADAAHALAQQLADLAAGLEGEPVRTVPRLHDLAVGDQVAVTGSDLLAALAARGPGPGDVLAESATRTATEAVRTLRDAL